MTQYSEGNDTGPRTSRLQILYPLLFAIMLAAGIGIGLILGNSSKGKVSVFTRTDYDRMDEILRYIDARYVDSVDTHVLFNDAIDKIFTELDPHSIYIPADELARMNEQLKGEFEGIGIEFFIVDDTIRVVSTLPGGPSEKLGIKAGDKIVKVADTSVTGPELSNQDVVGSLKGPAGSEVKVTIVRAGEPEPLEFTIKRDAVNIQSVDAAYMITDKIGYIKLARFAANTHDEFLTAIKELKEKGMKKMILDLRDNGGGYLDQATRLADEFLDDNKIIVYTEGRAYPKKVYRAGRPGAFEKGDLVVMINEHSASASEILTGALQDHKRATIVGRRSFGKALVQEEIGLKDGAAMRLTVARYYTPNGRSIQRSYANGVEAYNEEYYNRIVSEYEHPDSFNVSDTAHYGIEPDVYIPFDTSGGYEKVIRMVNGGQIPKFTYRYFSNHAPDFQKYTEVDQFLASYTVPDKLYQDFVSFVQSTADSTPVKWMANNPDQYKKALEAAIKAYFAKQLFYYAGFYPAMNKLDRELDKAVEVLQ